MALFKQAPKKESQKKPEEKHSLFSSKPPTFDPKQLEQLSISINDLSRRQRLSEERINNIRRTFQVTEQNMITNDKNHSDGLRLLNMEMNQLHKDIEEIKDKMRLIIKELKLSAKLEDVKIMNKYFEMWNPVNFVTQQEIEDIVERKLLELKNK